MSDADVERALGVLDSILRQARDLADDKQVLPIQVVVDIMKSPLFGAMTKARYYHSNDVHVGRGVRPRPRATPVSQITDSSSRAQHRTAETIATNHRAVGEEEESTEKAPLASSGTQREPSLARAAPQKEGAFSRCSVPQGRTGPVGGISLNRAVQSMAITCRPAVQHPIRRLPVSGFLDEELLPAKLPSNPTTRVSLPPPPPTLSLPQSSNGLFPSAPVSNALVPSPPIGPQDSRPVSSYNVKECVKGKDKGVGGQASSCAMQHVPHEQGAGLPMIKRAGHVTKDIVAEEDPVTNGTRLSSEGGPLPDAIRRLAGDGGVSSTIVQLSLDEGSTRNSALKDSSASLGAIRRYTASSGDPFQHAQPINTQLNCSPSPSANTGQLRDSRHPSLRANGIATSLSLSPADSNTPVDSSGSSYPANSSDFSSPSDSSGLPHSIGLSLPPIPGGDPSPPVIHSDSLGHSDIGEEVDAPTSELPFFMRDESNQSKIMTSLGNRSERVVVLLKMTSDLGLELVGRSSTGVFVKDLEPGSHAHRVGGLAAGDQIVNVNGVNTANMASFEVKELIKGVPLRGNVSLVVKYNPTGLCEYMRKH